MEFLDIVDDDGNPTGQTIERAKAHGEGVMHRTSHVWLARKRGGRTEVLLQKRCDAKESFPGCYDISSAGHIPAGVGFKPSAVRELKEELGVEASEDELVLCGNRRIALDRVFGGKPFHDRQYSRVFALWRDLDEGEFRLQAEEVSCVRWMDLDQLVRAVGEDALPHCIALEELLMVKAALEGGGRWTLRSASMDEIGALTRISTDAFHSDRLVGGDGGGPEGYDSYDWHRGQFQAGRLFSLDADGRPVAGAILEKEGDTLRIHRIFLDPREFRKGYGVALMSEIERRFDDVRTFALDTPEWNVRTNAFYRKLGYQAVGTEQLPEFKLVLYEKRRQGAPSARN